MNFQDEMELQVEEKDGIAIVRLSGSVNAMHTPRLRKTIQNYLKSNSSGVVVDFNEVNYMDSSGVATLVEGYQLANDQGKKFAVSRMVQEQVWHILEITRLDELFENHESPETAAERLKRDRT